MSKDKLDTLRNALLELLGLCANKETGSMYMYTDQGYGVVTSLDRGEITDIYFRNSRGARAISMIKQINKAKFFFKKANVDTVKTVKRDESLPSNAEIFFQFGLNYHSEITKCGGRFSPMARKVLAVDDSGIARKAIVQTLLTKGYTVVEAKNGIEAMSQIAKEHPDLVLLDLILPFMDGYEVLSSMRDNEDYKHIPVIVLTSRSTLFDKLKGRMSGTDEYVTKPFKPAELLDKVAKYLD